MALPFLFTDNARSTLGAPLSVGGGTITLASGGGALFPNPAPGQQFTLTLNDLATQTVFETVWCTARAGDVLTVLRAQEGTAAHAWSTGDYCWNGPTAGVAQNMVQTPHMLDASIAPVFAATQVQGTFSATGAAAFSSTGTFGGAVTATDPSTGSLSGVAVQSTAAGTQGARIALRGDPGTTGTPNKWLRAHSGIFDILNSSYTTQILTLSDLGDLGAIRNITSSGSATLAGSVTAGGTGSFTDTGTNNGVFVGGTSGNGANIHLHTATGDKFLRTLNNAFHIVNASYTRTLFTLDDAGNLTVTGGATVPGAISAGSVAATGAVNGLAVSSTGGNVTAINGRLRASFGARGSGDPNAGTILADFFNSGSYNIFPNGVIIQWGSGTASCTFTQSEGGLTWFFGPANVTFGTAFPSVFASACVTAVDITGHLVFNANITKSPNLSGMVVVPHVTNVLNVDFYWMAIGW